MEGRIDEGEITGTIDAISLENIVKITEQMKTSICQIHAGNKKGTGFFCKIQYEGKNIPVLMTNYHVISDDFLQNNKKIKISINNGEKYDTIKVNENSKIYSSIRNEYDIMIIELEEKKDIYHYLELDEHLFDKDSEDIYEDKSIYILHYPKGDKVHVSYGYGIQKLDEYYIKHLCNTESCSSGSPIMNLKTNKVIGIHSGFINKEPKYNIGVLLKYPLNDLNKNNEIKITVQINKNDINKDIYFLDNTNNFIDNKNMKHYHDKLKELNELNTELFINYLNIFSIWLTGVYLQKKIFSIV